MGRNCVEEIIKHTPDRLEQVYLAEAAEGGRGNTRKDALEESLRKLSVPVRMLPRRELEALVGSDSHQGVVARLTPRKARNLDDVIDALTEAPYATILALDSVVDPHNTGAILRAAECFGVSAVVWSHNRSAPLGPVVSKVSVGASELLDLVPVSNLHRALEQLKESGFWLIGAAVGPDSSDLGAFTFPEKSVLVMGSEGDGMHHLIEKTLDFRVQIPMRGHISSLNVSQATAVLLAAIAGQRGGLGTPSSLVDKAK